MTAHVGESAGEITNAQAHTQLDTKTLVRTSQNTWPCSIQNMKIQYIGLWNAPSSVVLYRTGGFFYKKDGNRTLNVKYKWPKTSLGRNLSIFSYISVLLYWWRVYPCESDRLESWSWQILTDLAKDTSAGWRFTECRQEVGSNTLCRFLLEILEATSYFSKICCGRCRWLIVNQFLT